MAFRISFTHSSFDAGATETEKEIGTPEPAVGLGVSSFLKETNANASDVCLPASLTAQNSVTVFGTNPAYFGRLLDLLLFRVSRRSEAPLHIPADPNDQAA
jgi:hypothetical protein